MIRREFEQELFTKRMWVVNILWLAMMIAPGVMAVAVAIMAQEWTGTEPMLVDEHVKPALYVMAALAGIASILMRTYLLSPTHLAKESEALLRSLDQSGMSKATTPMETRAEVAFLRFQGNLLAIWAVADAIGMIGFVLAFIMQEPVVAYQLCAVAAVMILLIHKPATANLREAISIIKRQGEVTTPTV